MRKNNNKIPNKQMIINKLTPPGSHLKSDDLTPTQKEQLYEVMRRHEASRGFSYDRFFKEGFKSWEWQGIDGVKRDFLIQNASAIWPDPDNRPTAPDDERYNQVVTERGRFYALISGVHGLRKTFIDHMAAIGMGASQLRLKFPTDEWRDYERIGILSIVREFEADISS